ncbi:MAG: protein kinase family protein [Gammaproteobacteria bacterium]
MSSSVPSAFFCGSNEPPSQFLEEEPVISNASPTATPPPVETPPASIGGPSAPSAQPTASVTDISVGDLDFDECKSEGVVDPSSTDVVGSDEKDDAIESRPSPGFGNVVLYKGGHYKGMPVSIKAFPSSCGVAQSEIEKEVLIMSQLTGHPNILPFYGKFEDPTSCINLVMGDMQDNLLSDLLADTSKRIVWSLRYKFMTDIATAVKHLHTHGILHCDIRSHNCFLNTKNELQLGNFGLSCFMVKKNVAAFGAVAWRAPELLSDPSAFSFASDIYALGMLFYEIATRSEPLILRGDYPDLSSKKIPSGLKVLIEKCWNKNPGTRPRISDIESALKQFAEEEMNLIVVSAREVSLLGKDKIIEPHIDDRREIAKQAGILSSVASCPNIRGISSVYLGGDYAGCVMEDVQPYTLLTILEDKPEVLSWERRFNIALDVLNAIEFLFARKIAPVDVTSRNVFFDMANKVKLGNLVFTNDLAVSISSFAKLLDELKSKFKLLVHEVSGCSRELEKLIGACEENRISIENIKQKLTSFLNEEIQTPPILSAMCPNISVTEIACIAKLGQGSFAAVYKGTYGSKEVAIKKVPWPSAKRRREMMQEANNMCLVREHPNIVNIVGVSQNTDCFYLVMEIMNGGKLSDFLTDPQAPKLLSIRLKIAFDIAKAVQYMHSKGVLHCDIKVENILLKLENSEYTAKLADFGLSISPGQVNEHEKVANKGIAPEILVNGIIYGVIDPAALSPAADIYALGGVFHAMFSQYVEKDLVRFFATCQAKNPLERPTAAEIVIALQKFLEKALEEEHTSTSTCTPTLSK